MSKHSRAWIMLVVVAGCVPPAMAQTIYRCGDSYSQQPCPGGKPVAVEDSRTPAQRAQTTDAVKRQAAAADQLEKERVREEAKPASVGMPPEKVEEFPPQRDRTESAAKAKKPQYFTATSPRKPGEPAPKKKKAKAKAKKPPGKAAASAT
jgi:hypothetical protein